MKDLYTFSKSAWHVRLFKWIYKTDPTKTFKTMCPYFWSLVVTMIVLPLILVIKLFGKAGTKLLSKLESYKRDKWESDKVLFLDRCSKELTEEQAYKIWKTKCWDRYYYYLDYNVEQSIRDKYNNYRYYLNDQKKVKKEKITEIKESKYFMYLAYIISAVVISTVLYVLYYLVSMIEFTPIDWEFVGVSTLLILGAIVIVFSVIGIWNYVVIPLSKRISCMECKLCQYGIGSYILSVLKFIWRGIVIICDMIYMTYKQACPRITWKNEQ